MEQRKYPRIKTRIVAEINDSQALLENVSREGVKIKLWADAVPKNQDVEVAFKVGKQSINLKGVIRWCRRDKYSLQDLKELGLHLAEPPEEYYQFIDTISNQMEPIVQI
jgi:hypothetical protein